jgi:CRP-like cAMP-binding protein
MTAVERLKDVPLLSSLTNRELKRVARNVRENRFDAGTSIVREGQRGRFGFFILEEGEAPLQSPAKQNRQESQAPGKISRQSAD